MPHTLFAVAIKYEKFFTIYWNTVVCLLLKSSVLTENRKHFYSFFFLMSVFNSEIFSLPEKLEKRAIPYIPVCLLPWRNDFCRVSLQMDWAWRFQPRTDPCYQVWSLHAEHIATGITPKNNFLSDLKACLPDVILGENCQGISDRTPLKKNGKI